MLFRRDPCIQGPYPCILRLKYRAKPKIQGSDGQGPPDSHSQNDKQGTDCEALKETVRRLQFWILQITGALDIEEDPNNVSFPNPRSCRELDMLKKEVETLREKCKECHSKNPGGDQQKIPTLERGVDALKQGLKATMDRLDQFLSHQKKDNARVREIQQALDVTRDELAAWAVHLQQQQQVAPRGSGENHNEAEESYQTPITVLTTKASKGDVVIEVTDPDKYQIRKYIVIQESLIYLVDRTEDDGEIYLHNPLQSHSHNAGHGNSTNSHSHKEILQTPMGRMGMEELRDLLNWTDKVRSPPWGMEKPMRRTNLSDFPVENQNLLLKGWALQSRI